MAYAQVPLITVDNIIVPALQTVLPMTITIGRDDPSAQPDANALTFGYLGEYLPSYLRRGAPVKVGLRWDPLDVWDDIWSDDWIGERSYDVDAWRDIWDDIWQGQYTEPVGRTRFVGTLSDITVNPIPQRNMIQAQVTCIGTLTSLGDTIVGDEPWPMETDAERAQRLVPYVRGDNILHADGSTFMRLRGRDVDRRKMLELLHLFAGSVGSILWEYPDGSMHYQRWDYRDVPDEATLIWLPPQAIVADGTEWSQSTAQLIDRVRVEYGDDPEGAERPEFVAGSGMHEAKLSGEVADVGTAEVVANVVLERWSRDDMWAASAVRTRSDLLTEQGYADLLAILPSDPLGTGHLTQIPSPGTEGEGRWFIEGWTETWDRSGNGAPLVHEFDLSVSDVRQFAVQGQEVEMVLSLQTDSTHHNFIVQPVGATTLPRVGLLRLSIDGMEPIYPIDLGTLDYATWVWFIVPTARLSGTQTAQVFYTGYPREYRPTVTNTLTFTAPTPQMTLTAPTTVPHVGDLLPLVATVHQNPSLPGVQPNGQAWIERSTGNAEGPWVRVSDVSNVSGKDEYEFGWTWPVEAVGETYFRGAFVPDESYTVPPANSAVLPILPQRQQGKYVIYECAWHTCLGEPLTGGIAGIWQGEWDPHQGDRKTWIGWTESGGIPVDDWRDYRITRVELFLQPLAWGDGLQAGTARIGSHNHRGIAGAVDYDTPIVHRQDVQQWPVGVGKWVDITSWGKGLLTGDIAGCAVGPADREGPLTKAEFAGIPDGGGGGPAEQTWDSLSAGVTWNNMGAGDWDSWMAPSAEGTPPRLRVTGYRWAPL